MRVRHLIPLVALAATVVAIGCGKKPPAPTQPEGELPANLDVGSPLYKPTDMPAESNVRSANEPLVIPNCTVQYENRVVVSAEVDGKIDLIAVKPELLRKGTYIQRQADGSITPLNPTLTYPGVKFVDGVAQGDRVEALPQDTLVYERRPNGTAVLVPGSVFQGGTHYLAWRKDRSVLPYPPTPPGPFPLRKEGDTELDGVRVRIDAQRALDWQVRGPGGTELLTLALRLDLDRVPYWEIRVADPQAGQRMTAWLDANGYKYRYVKGQFDANLVVVPLDVPEDITRVPNLPPRPPKIEKPDARNPQKPDPELLRETALKVSTRGEPFWEIRQRDTTEESDPWRVIEVPLDRWPDHSLIAGHRPDGSLVMADPPEGFPNLQLHPDDDGKKVLYRRLSEGNVVSAGQVVCFLDASIVSNKLIAARRAKEAAEEIRYAAARGVELSKEKLNLTRAAQGGVAYSEIVSETLTKTRFQENLANANQSIAKADQDYSEATELLRKHRLRSPLNGTVRKIVKSPGETVKGGERIMDIEGVDVVRLEGHLDVQYAAFVKSTVIVEPAVPSAPSRNHSGHQREVTALAVTAHTNQPPLIVSASADGAVLVWSPYREDGPVGADVLPHPNIAVRAVACTPPGFRQVLVATGADDGKIRLWDLTDPRRLPPAPRELAEAHTSAVGAVAFSPNGEFIASAANREVSIWRTTTGEKLYSLPVEHRDIVTSVSFTPQATLVTISRDRTIKVWKLGTERAAAVLSLDHRSGAVDVLGVSPDGGQVLFDKDPSQLNLVSLADRHRPPGQLRNLGATATFATSALFSPRYKIDDKQTREYIATVGGEGELKGVLQAWTRPAVGSRGSEVARLITPGRFGVTAAAFSQSDKYRFLVAGTEKGTVHLWTPPEAALLQYKGEVTNIDYTDPRYATVRVRLDNRVLNLPDRSAATIIVENPGR